MPITPDEIVAVQPAATAATAPQPVDEVEIEIPDEVLQIPALTGLLEGKPAAVYSPDGVKDPQIDIVLKHAKELQNAGFGFYHTLDGKNNVLFNAAFLTADEIKQADKEGRLDEVAVPFSELTASFERALAGAAPAAVSEPAPSPAASPAASGAPASPATDKKLATARLKNVQPGAPTSGTRPGAGRILNSITKPVV